MEFIKIQAAHIQTRKGTRSCDSLHAWIKTVRNKIVLEKWNMTIFVYCISA